MSAAQGLEYIISLTDQISAPLKGVMKSIDDLGKRGEAAMKKIGLGVAGIVGAGFALKSALDPAIELNRALGEVHSLGVADDALEKLSKTALNFSSQYGESAVDFVRSSYDIQSAIAGLNGNELAEFTQTSNLLAKGTKASAATITNYMGTMYGIFAEDAAKLGNANWVNKIAGQTALAVKMFKTSGDGMSAAFTSLGAAAKAAKIDVAEQFGVLGNLQATMSGSEAGTKYKAFLAGVSGAQKELGLSFVDTNGDMLDMVTILNKIKGKFGDTLDVAQAAKLKKAFGSDQAVDLIKLLLPKTKELKNNIAAITKVSDTKALAQMARSMVDPWSRLSQIITGVKTAIGGEILKKLDPIMHKVADLGQKFIDWLKTYKNIARWIGYIIGASIGFAAVAATISLVSGAMGLLKVGAIAAFAPIRGLLSLMSLLGKPLVLIRSAIMLIFAGFKTLISVVWAVINPLKMLRLVFAFAFSPLSILLLAGLAIYKFRHQLKDLWNGVKQGFGSLESHLAPLYRAFDIVKSAGQKVSNAIGRIAGLFSANAESAMLFQNVGVAVGQAIGFAFDVVLFVIELIARQIEAVATIFSNVADVIIATWHNVIDDWESKSAWDIFKGLATGIGQIFTTILKGIKDQFINTINWIIDKVNIVSGKIGFELPKIPNTWLSDDAQVTTVTAASNISSLGLNAAVDNASWKKSPSIDLPNNLKPQLNSMPQGSVTKTLTQNRTEQRTINYGGLAFYGYDKNEIKQELRNKEQLAAG
ncbi:phage tail tape measure protein [Haemophilus influenzae]|uniref:phage tail tape measure protein n=1 Tax=Haemophilus influenzae TaxID=727 RepID=UPI00313AAE68